jgi:hypothetical protein
VFVFSRSDFEILLNLFNQYPIASAHHLTPSSALEATTHLEQILLITQRFLLLLPQLVERIVMPVEIDKLVVTLDDGLPDSFTDIL